MELDVRTHGMLVEDQARAAQAAAPGKSLDFTVGSVLRALADAFAGAIGLWMQAQVLRLLTVTRAATSRGADLDTWVADFGLIRRPAVAAQGEVVLSRRTTGIVARIPAGSQVRAQGGTVYLVEAQADHPSWKPELGAYEMSAAQASITVPVIAAVAGSAGNADPGTVTLLASAIIGIDDVTNAAAITGGDEAETDDELRVRFRAYLGSLSKATIPALEYAISSVQPGLSWKIIEGEGPSGIAQPAVVTVIVDDGSGAPSADLIARVANALEQVRALGVTYLVVSPQLMLANVTMVLDVNPVADRPVVVGRVQTALAAFIEAIPVGEGLSYTRLISEAYRADTRVRNIVTATLNGGTADIPASVRIAVRPGVIAVS